MGNLLVNALGITWIQALGGIGMIFVPLVIWMGLLFAWFMWNERYKRVTEQHEKYDNKKYRYITWALDIAAVIFILCVRRH